MLGKNLFLVAGILTLLVFIGYLSEPGPHVLFGYSINIWIVRIAWLLIAITNFASYFKLKKEGK
jgi:hypothetical protein